MNYFIEMFFIFIKSKPFCTPSIWFFFFAFLQFGDKPAKFTEEQASIFMSLSSGWTFSSLDCYIMWKCRGRLMYRRGRCFFFCFSSVYCANTGTLTSFKYCNIDTLKQTGIDSIQTIDSWLQSATLKLTSCKQMNKQMLEMKIDLLDALWSIIYIFSTLNFFSFCKKKDFPLQWSQSIWFIISSYANCENYIIKGFSI